MTDVIAIDGPSGSGKSSTSRGVASRLGYAYLDTGAMYRAMTWALLQRGVDVHDADAVAAAAHEVVLTSGTDPAGPTIAADGVDVSGPIRGDEVTSAVSPVATVPEVRELLVSLQREAIARATGGIVVEGRDIGTVVAPDAGLKIYLVADPVARAKRRAAELGVEDADAMREALARRDAIDSNRAASPLAQADDAVVVDGTDLTLDQVIDHIVALAQQ
ncbi:(d)CMP kinase [Aeromicrobium sp. 636]|uniref:Cytidylate kinase n=1 Tax=Aeromicrobium senzhongii TaxID=2663859 RepID=A0A8I0JYY1_9ACTN|nr:MULTISPECIES: (d)CMP kinase [Aeromicrobium]MBC9224706.1 (d)CMP kinase [Aeromicrobium senzhongii]MCQ3996819.1 (d)CMP kinase [Aeromicrobium sp. 636]MTB86751.1 (d)CMP kinase [Aeromicrobium senzhongii]QNL93400.1 (d)CMP kinase [Aeromicrobium senzhongii]